MKKILLFLSFLLMSIGMWSTESLYKETIFNSSNNSASIQNYTSTWYNTTNGFRVDLSNANNNQNGWNYIKFGRKNNASTGTIITNATIDKKITKVGITIDALTASKITSITLYTSTNGSSWTSRGTFAKSTGTQYNEIYSNNQAENLYYKIEFVCQSGSSNGLITISHVYFYVDEDEPITPCDSVTVSLITPTHGTASLSKTKVCPNDEIEITYNPDDGYMLDKILANGVEVENPITITESTTIQVLFKEIPPESSIDVVEWNPDYIKVDIDNFGENVSAIIQNQNTQSSHEEKVADDIFFSKYFEAGGTNKMLAFYNGTKDTINLKHYTFKLAKINVTPVNLGDYGNYQDSMMLPNTEILFVHYDGTNSAKDCADDIDGYQNWIESPNSGYLYSHLNFGGRASIGLYKDGVLIDIIGIHDGSDPLQINKPCTYAKITGLNDDVGFYTYAGDNIKTDTEEHDYFLSTNRCMLVRKNTVVSGSNAVLKNYHDGVNDECSDTIALQFKTLSEEWMGYQIGDGDNDAALRDSTCTGLAYAGHYNYNDYYVTYEALDTIDLDNGIYDSETGLYTISIPELDTLSCTNLKVIVSDGESTLEKTYKIPIFVQDNISTTHETFTKEGPDCATCDVVVLNNKTLTVAGTTSVNRDVKLYPGAKLLVPTSTSYSINSLALRRDNNTVSTLGLVGTLTLSHLYFDLYIDCKDWYYVALPDTFTLSKLKFANGKKTRHRYDYWVKYYDGKHRAETQSGSWRTAKNDTLFQPGAGFIIGLNDDLKKKELRFEFNATQTLLNERGNKTAGNLHAWGINNTELRPNHKGWNLVGNPYMNIYDTDFAKAIRAGYLYKDETSGTWNGQWLLSDTTSSKLRYAVIPSKDPADAAAGGYKSVTLDERPLDPFICFFVQMGGANDNAQTLQFKQSQKRNSIVARRAAMFEDEEDDELFLRIKIGDNKTGCFISNKFSKDYEPGDDLESRYGHYQLINGYKLLYSAINDSIIENGIQIHSNGGKVTLDPKVEVDKFEEIYVLDGKTWYDLLHGDEPEVSGDFILYAKRKVQEDIPTGIDNVKPGQGTYKFSYGEHVYINNNGSIYNMLGTKLK